MERFWSKVDKRGPIHPVLKTRCWLWTGSLNAAGYGRISYKCIPYLAHRFAWFLKYGKLPKKQACHHCDVTNCVRWDHLFDGSQKDNMQDKMAKGRHKIRGKGKRFWHTTFTEKKAERIRSLYKTGKYSQQDLALKFGYSKAFIGRVILRIRYAVCK